LQKDSAWLKAVRLSVPPTMLKDTFMHKILDIRDLTESTYVLRLEKNDFNFKAGQYLVLNIPGENNAREYSIYSPENMPYIELLIKEITDGDVSVKLKSLKIGTKLEISGPFGFFVLRDNEQNENGHFTFVATGTGISPFRSMIMSNPGLSYELIHGVKYNIEAYDSSDYAAGCYAVCTSQEKGVNFSGRVTQYLSENGVRKDSKYYICGNSCMVNEVTCYLEQNGIQPENIRTEIFF
jgi:ferredoxin/flavodoxin---NADP+ reductase